MGIKSSSLGRISLLEILSYIFGGGKGKSQNSWPGVGRGLIWCVLASKYCTLLLGSVLEL